MVITKVDKLVHTIDFSQGEPMRFLLTSDWHIDNPHCNRKRLFNHLDYCLDNDIKVIVNGDLFCFMQGKYDPRRSKMDVRPEHNKANYIDAVIEDTVNLLSKYKDVIVFVGAGNHETALLKNLETDVTRRFIDLFNYTNKAQVAGGGYRGWIIIRGEKSERKYPLNIYYHHGHGGGGEMTAGVLQHRRMNIYTERADVIWMGHVHDLYILPDTVEYLENNGGYAAKERMVYNIRTSTYKEEYIGNDGGFHIEKGRRPKTIGSILMDLDYIRENNSIKIVPSFTPLIENK